MDYLDVARQLAAAKEGESLFGRADYYTNPFAIQDSLDAALEQKQLEEQAKAIIQNPKLLEEYLGTSGESTSTGVSPVVNGTPTAQSILDLADLSENLDIAGMFLPGPLGTFASIGSKLSDYMSNRQYDSFLERQALNDALFAGGGQIKSDSQGNLWGFNPANDTYVTSGGQVVSAGGLSDATKAGLAANMETFGSGESRDYFGD